ncbi:hypothetical protein Tco_0659803 [Tanacetum coccineum]
MISAIGLLWLALAVQDPLQATCFMKLVHLSLESSLSLVSLLSISVSDGLLLEDIRLASGAASILSANHKEMVIAERVSEEVDDVSLEREVMVVGVAGAKGLLLLLIIIIIFIDGSRHPCRLLCQADSQRDPLRIPPRRYLFGVLLRVGLGIYPGVSDK